MPERIVVAGGKEGLEDFFLEHDKPERKITTGDSLSANEHIRRNTHACRGEHRAGATKSGNDFITDHEDVVFCADLADLRQPFSRRDDNASHTLNRFGD